MDIETHKTALEAEKVRLEGELSALGQKNPRVANDWEVAPEELGIEPDLLDQADIVVNRENTAAIFADLESRYDVVVEALGRIGNATYGVCEVCGGSIEEARLTADPAATTCVKDV